MLETAKVQILLSTLTDNERWILEVLRTLRPFENIQITADKTGRINNYLIVRTQKVMLTDDNPVHI